MKKIERCISDRNFKAIFLENKNALAHLISSVTNINYELLKDNLSIQVNEIPIQNKDEKFKKTDFLVTVDNHIINIEANNSYTNILKAKNTSYMMELYSENAKKGENYNPYLSFIQINLNSYNKKEGEVLCKYYICDPKTGKIYLNSFVFYDLDLAKCHKLFYNLDDSKITDYIRWGAFLYSTDYDELDNILGNMLPLRDKKKILSKVEDINMRKDYTLTDKECKYWGEFIENGIRKEGYDEGKEEGYTEGISVGKEEGYTKGISVGAEKTITNTIKSMLGNSLNYELISKVTGKSIEEIKEIENSMKE